MKNIVKTESLIEQFGSYYQVLHNNSEYVIIQKLGLIDKLNYWAHQHATLEEAKKNAKLKRDEEIKYKIKEFEEYNSNIFFNFLSSLTKIGILNLKTINKSIEIIEEDKKLLISEYIPKIENLSGEVTIPFNYPKLNTVYYYVDFSEKAILEDGLKIIPMEVSESKIYHDPYNNSALMAFDFKGKNEESTYLSTDGVESFNSKYYDLGSSAYIYKSEDDIKKDFILICEKIKEKHTLKIEKISKIIEKSKQNEKN